MSTIGIIVLSMLTIVFLIIEIFERQYLLQIQKAEKYVLNSLSKTKMSPQEKKGIYMEIKKDVESLEFWFCYFKNANKKNDDKYEDIRKMRIKDIKF